MPGLLKIWIKGLKQRGMQRREFWGSELVCLTRRLWTVADAPSRVSYRRTIHRRCSRIFCTASHTVGDNKLCGIYLIFHFDLNYIMGSQRQWTVFELLDLLSAVNMQLYVCRKNRNYSGFVWTFYTLNWFSSHFRWTIQIWTTCTCSSAYKLVEKSNLCPWVHA